MSLASSRGSKWPFWETPSFGLSVPSHVPGTARIFLCVQFNLFNQRRNFLSGWVLLAELQPHLLCCWNRLSQPRLDAVGKSSSKNKFSKAFLGVEPPEAPQDSGFLELLQGFPQCLGWQLGQGLGAQILVKFSLSPFGHKGRIGVERPLKPQKLLQQPPVMFPGALYVWEMGSPKNPSTTQNLN